MSETTSLSKTAAIMVIRLSGKKHYTIPTEVKLAKMDGPFELEMEDGKKVKGDAGDFIGVDSLGHLSIVPKVDIGVVYRPARKSKKVPVVTK